MLFQPFSTYSISFAEHDEATSVRRTRRAPCSGLHTGTGDPPSRRRPATFHRQGNCNVKSEAQKEGATYRTMECTEVSRLKCRNSTSFADMLCDSVFVRSASFRYVSYCTACTPVKYTAKLRVYEKQNTCKALLCLMLSGWVKANLGCTGNQLLVLPPIPP